MENLIEELTKVNPSNLSEEGLKLFNKINEIIDRNIELEVKLKLSKELYDDACKCLLDTIEKSKIEEIIKYKKQKLNNLEYSSDRYRRTCLQAEIDFGEELLQEGDK